MGDDRLAALNGRGCEVIDGVIVFHDTRSRKWVQAAVSNAPGSLVLHPKV